MKETIIVMGGSFNPPTLAHQRLLLGAVNAMGADKGIFVPSSHTYVTEKMNRTEQSKAVLPEQLRLQLLQAMCADDPRLEVETCEFSRTEEGCSYDSMELIREKHPDGTIYYLVGGDKLAEIPHWYRIGEFLERFCILVIRRNGEDPEAVLQENAFLRANENRFRIIPAPCGLEGISSSMVRDKLRTGDPGAKDLLHPGVWALLQENEGEYHVF